MLTRRTTLGLLLAAPAVLLARPVFAAEPEVYSDAGVALRGTDPVAYFTDAAAVAGAAAFALMWKGTEWRFASAQNREAFEMNPDRFAPAFGGYCAYAMSQGHYASTVPQAWTIHENRLFLNYSTEVRAIWQSDVPGHVARADRFWAELRAS